MKKKQVDKFPHYFICYNCATKLGGTMPENACNTVHSDVCLYCNNVETLYATTDFNYPGKKAIWD